ncbi:hypothetical protein [Alkalibaculum sporogenes]|nr:hypothetical protein [Alkalibaculum sporogenes]
MDLIERYILANLNNLLISFGGVKLKIYLNMDDRALLAIVKSSIDKFNIDVPKNNRKGYGSYINYINRINSLLGIDKFSIDYIDISKYKIPEGVKEYRIYNPQNRSKELEYLIRGTVELKGRSFCGIDIGGNSIKAAAVVNGEIELLKGYRWFPDDYKTADEINNPVLLLIRFLSAYIVYKYSYKDDPLSLGNSEVFEENASYKCIEKYTKDMEALINSDTRIFDGVVIGFPDIVIRNKVAGGETPKQRGIRNNSEIDYDQEFLKMSHLDILAKQYIKENGKVRILNDGNIASYVVSVEHAFLDENSIGNSGMFAHTIGTDIGTGFISRTGTIQDIPLECYQYVIDLGSLNESRYVPEDARSIRNLNTSISGSVQKYVSQVGLIRLGIKNIQNDNPKIYSSLFEKGYLQYKQIGGQEALVIPTEPVDKRGELTRYLIELLNNGNMEIEKTFLQMGEMMGKTMEEMKFFFYEIPTTRLISGGILATDICFDLFHKGLKVKYPKYEIQRLDEDVIKSPLLKKLNKKNRNYISAVGAVYIINREFI